MKIEAGKEMIFITSWPNGRALKVTILGENQNIKDGWFFRKPNGRSDTTTPEFLFEMESQQ